MLAAYGVGLLPVLLIRSAVASFVARGDTRTPMVVALASVGVNVALKLVLYEPYGAPGLALATAVGAWVNFAALVALATRQGAMRADGALMRVGLAAAVGALALVVVALTLNAPLLALAERAPRMQEVLHVAMLGTAGALAYAIVLFGVAQALGLRLPALMPRARTPT